MDPANTTIGIVGLGQVGSLYAKQFSEAGYDIVGSDLPERIPGLRASLQDTGITIFSQPRHVVEESDLVLTCLPIPTVRPVYRELEPFLDGETPIVDGSSVMFHAYQATTILDGVDSYSLHLMARPDPAILAGKNMVAVPHSNHNGSFEASRELFTDALRVNVIELPSYEHHDSMPSVAQGLVHLLNLGRTASLTAETIQNPHLNNPYAQTQALMGLRMVAGDPAMYGNLAMYNPFMREMARQYATSMTEIHELMKDGQLDTLRDRINEAIDSVYDGNVERLGIPLSEFEGISLLTPPDSSKTNSNLPFLAWIDTCRENGVNPYQYTDYKTPPFTALLATAELFLTDSEAVEASIIAGVEDGEMQALDAKLVEQTQRVTDAILARNMSEYRGVFETVDAKFPKMIKAGNDLSTGLIKRII